jgi:phosphotransferase system HPr (HPr) family protein
MLASSEVAVVLPEGVALHARPAALFVRRAMTFASRITVVKGEREADAKSILGVLGLGALGGTSLILRADGNDADEALATLAELVPTLA